MENEILQRNTSKIENDYFRLWLQKQFTEYCKRNPRFSLRAFAKILNLEASSLSQILSGKRKVSKKNIRLLISNLSPSPIDMKLFGLIDDSFNLNNNYLQLNIDTFTAISDWYHYAILELTYIDGFKAEPKWIAKKLSITTEEVKSALERLKRLGLLIEEKGSLIKTSRQTTNNGNINTSSAHKELQRQIISKSLKAIDECPQEEKDITSITMAIDVKNLNKAKILIQKFRRELCALLEEGNQDQVYNLAIQLYPISKKEE